MLTLQRSRFLRLAIIGSFVLGLECASPGLTRAESFFRLHQGTHFLLHQVGEEDPEETEEPEEQPPKDTPFLKAVVKADGVVRELNKLKAELPKAKPEEKDKMQEAYNNKLPEAEKALREALNLYSQYDQERHLNYVRYLLTYIYVLQGRNLEASVLGEYMARHLPVDNTFALEGADFAFKAMYVEFQTVRRDGRDYSFEQQRVAILCELMIERWPEGTKTADARAALASIAHQRGELLKSAEYYLSVPESSYKYRDAQLEAGKIYFSLYNEPDKLPEEYSREQLKELLDKADQHLKVGIDQAQALEPLPPNPPVAVIYGKINRAQIQLEKDKAEEAITILTQDPYPVVKWVGEEKDKIPEFVQNAEQWKLVAGLVHRILLRCYVGQGNVEEARNQMKRLEEIAGEDDTSFLTGIYVDLGKQLEKQLKNLKDIGPEERYDQVKESFQTLLDDIVKQEKGQTLSGLLWVASTYTAFGEAEPKEGASYYQKAAETYKRILEVDEDQPNFLKSAAHRLHIQMKQVDSLKHAEEYDEALQILASILSVNSKVLDAQIAAAEVLEAQAEDDHSNGGQLYLDAINGTKIGTDPQAQIWGWGTIALQLQRLIEKQREQEMSTSLLGWREIALGRPQERLEIASTSRKSQLLSSYEEKHFNAWYHTIQCRYEHALLQAGAKQTEGLQAAQSELLLLETVIGKTPKEWATRYNELYNKVRGKLGLPEEKLFNAAEETQPALTGTSSP